MSYEDEVLADEPVLYLPLQEDDGTTAVDLSGNDLHGTYVDVDLAQPGPFRGAASVGIDGSTDEITVASDSVMAVDFTEGRTIELWVRYAAGTGEFARIIARAGDSNNGLNVAFASNGNAANGRIGTRWRAGGTTRQAQAASGTSPRGTWLHYVSTVVGTTVAIYINGVAVTASASGGSVAGDTTWRIGQSGGGSDRIVGNVAHVAYYHHAISPERVLAHYRAAIPLAPPPLGRRMRVWDGVSWAPVG